MKQYFITLFRANKLNFPIPTLNMLKILDKLMLYESWNYIYNKQFD